jgi:hypothetical protein
MQVRGRVQLAVKPLGQDAPAVDNRNTKTMCNAGVESDAGVRIQQQSHWHPSENSALFFAPAPNIRLMA